jgi:spore photoproduct lyase
VVITPAALEWPHGRAMVERAAALGAEVTELKSNRLTGLSDADARREYVNAKSTLAVTTASPAKRRLQPIPPSADWRFDLAEGCPAHCQYCYLAGSLSGPPVTRAYANLEEIFAGLGEYVGRGTITSRSTTRAHEGTTFEASCYTDPLGIEHLTGSLAEAIRFFGRWNADAQLRWTTKYDGVEGLLGLPHAGRTRVRFSVNAEPVTRRLEGGTAALPARLRAMGRMARSGYPVGLTIAPIMPIDGWREHYAALLEDSAAALSDAPDLDLTVELITHRFTPGSKEVLTDWYPGSSLEMDESVRARKTTKFGSLKYVYPAQTMRELRGWFEQEVGARLPAARVLYWT